MRLRAATLAACIATTAAVALPAAAPAAVSVKRGDHFGARIFPSDKFTTPDPAQLTGRRVNFRKGTDYPTVDGTVRADCTDATYSLCDAFDELNKLDGFDIQPRVTVPFTGSVDLASINDSNFFITTDRGRFASGLRQLTFNPATQTLAGIADEQLLENTRYRIHLTNGVRDSSGQPIDACTAECVVRFSTRTASGELVGIRKALDLPLSDPDNAYAIAGVPDARTSTSGRKLTFTQDGKNDVFPAASIAPSVADPLNGISRNDQVKADANAPGAFKASAAPNLIPPGTAGFFAFGSFLSPRYQFASASAHQDNGFGTGDGFTDGEIPPVPTGRTPRPFAADRLGVAVVTPNPAVHPPPWPAAVYGPGFTRSKLDLFVTADYNAAQGIVTVATDPSGHGFGPMSTITVTSSGTPTTFRSYARGRDLDGDGTISDGINEGVGPTGHAQPDGSELPSHKPIDGLQSGLIQSTVDNMVLGRALQAGLDIPGVGTDLVDTNRIMYYGLSFGGIYGTMLMGTDPLFHQGLLNVPGGPIVDIARLSGFRNNLAAQIKRSRPVLLNGGPGLEGFTEDLPLRNEPPRVIEHQGAGELQELFGESNWFERSGSPETFAPRIRLRPDPAWADNPKNVAFQTAFADGTVPNPTAGTLYRAGDLFDRVVYYRNDRTPTFQSDPHGFLADPSLAGRTSGEQQLGAFLSTGQLVSTNPAFLETTIANPNNLECLHYPDPQTGQPQARQSFPASGECPPAPARGTPGQATSLRLLISHRDTRASGGATTVAVRCQGSEGARCKGQITLQTTGFRGRGQVGAARAGGTVRFDLAAEETTRLRVQLPRATVAQLAKKRKAVVRAVAPAAPAGTAKKLLTVIAH